MQRGISEHTLETEADGLQQQTTKPGTTPATQNHRFRRLEKMFPVCLDCCCNIQMVFGINNMDPSIYSWQFLVPLVPAEDCLKPTAYPSIAADHVHPFMTESSNGCSQQNDHKAQIISEWFLEHDNECAAFKGLIKSQSNRASLGSGGMAATATANHGLIILHLQIIDRGISLRIEECSSVLKSKILHSFKFLNC